MPIYEYECEKCGDKFEYFLRWGGVENEVNAQNAVRRTRGGLFRLWLINRQVLHVKPIAMAEDHKR